MTTGPAELRDALAGLRPLMGSRSLPDLAGTLGRYRAALGDGSEAANVIALGALGERLQALLAQHADLLLAGESAALKRLLALHEPFIAEQADWKTWADFLTRSDGAVPPDPETGAPLDPEADPAPDNAAVLAAIAAWDAEREVGRQARHVEAVVQNAYGFSAALPVSPPERGN